MLRTMNFLMITLAILVAALVGAQQPTPAYSVTISLAADNAKSSGPIIVNAKVTNISNQSPTLHTWALRYFDADVRDSEGNLAPMTEMGRLWKEDNPDSLDSMKHRVGARVLPEPGKSIIEIVNLTDFYILKPGTYQVKLYSGNLVSNTILLVVTP